MSESSSFALQGLFTAFSRGGWLASILWIAGCASPLDGQAEDDLKRSVQASVERQLQEIPEFAPQVTQALVDPLAEDFAQRREELREIGPQVDRAGSGLDVGLGIDGTTMPVASLSLQGALHSAVRHNLGIEQVRIEQGIAAAEIVRAEAVFDAVVGAGVNFARIDQDSVEVVGLPGPSLPASSAQDLRQWGFTTDVTKRLSSGAVVQVGMDLEQQEVLNQPGLIDPNPAWTSAITTGLSQPLLRGFGSDVNTSNIQLARNNDRRSVVRLQNNLLDLLVNVEAAYWNLVMARQQLVIADWLVIEGERIRDILDSRRGFDTTLAQFADAVATVESRKTRVIDARRSVSQAADQLKMLINDPALPVGGEVDLVPADFMVDEPMQYDLRDSVTTALGHSPLMDLAVLSIDDASIQEIVARNGRLPQLDLAAEISWMGLAGSAGSSLGNINGEYVDYVMGLQFSQAVGNRAAESVYRQARLQRSAAVIGYRQSVQQVIFDVKSSIRDIKAGYALISQARNFRLAQAENLRALDALRRTLAALTPEFLNLLFQRQERLAEAQLQELKAMVDYNLAVADLERATGKGLEANNIDLLVVEASGENNGR